MRPAFPSHLDLGTLTFLSHDRIYSSTPDISMGVDTLLYGSLYDVVFATLVNLGGRGVESVSGRIG